MTHKTDIQNIEDIRRLVHAFYGRAQIDALLGPVFFARIPGDWGPHIEKICAFWNAALFGLPGYAGHPFAAHRGLPLEARHFDRWVDLFCASVDELFQGEFADDAKSRARKMADMFLRRIEEERGSGMVGLV